MTTFDIKSNDAQISVPSGQDRIVGFTIDNTTSNSVPAKLWIEAEPAVAGDWIKVEELLTFAPAERGRLVEVKLAIPPDAKKGAYSFKLGIQNTDQPDDGVDFSPTVNLNVEKEGGGVPAWVWVVAGVVVVLGIALAIIIPSLGGPEPEPEPEPKPEPTCIAVDQSCTSADTCCNDLICLEGTCQTKPEPEIETFAQAGQQCDAMKCAEGLQCITQKGRKRCLWPSGKGCEDDLHCQSGYCDKDKGCTRPPVHKECNNNDACYENQVCKYVREMGQKYCFWQDGQACSESNDCFSQFCYRKRCQKPKPCPSKCRGGMVCNQGTGRCQRAKLQTKDIPLKSISSDKIRDHSKIIKNRMIRMRPGGGG